VGTSGDYAPFSTVEEGEWVGFDIALAQRFAAENAWTLEFVRFEWPQLMDDLLAGSFDVAMSGVTVRPDRSLEALFTLPMARSGSVVIAPSESPVMNLDALNKKEVRIGVNQGGHLERVTRKRFPQATIVVSSDNQEQPKKLLSGDIDFLITDTMEAPFWLEQLPGARKLPPFTRDLKAWMTRPENAVLANQLNEWLMAKEADGSLSALRREYLPEGNDYTTALPLDALLSAIDERLSLMVAVAESKRRLGRPVEDLAQESRVLEAAVRGVVDASEQSGLEPPNREAVEALFQSLIEAAKGIQYKTLLAPPTMEDPPDLVTELRPALARISGRINFLILRLDADSAAEIGERTRTALSGHGLSDTHLSEIEDSLLRLTGYK